MAKTKKKALENNAKKITKEKEKGVQHETESKEFDFGGIPNVDIKKNMGCGG